MKYLEKDNYGIPISNKKDAYCPKFVGVNMLIDNTIHNQRDEELGVVEEVVLDSKSGKVIYVVVSYGGFLGIRKKLFAVPWQALKLDTDKKRYVLNVDTYKLSSAPGFDRHHWPDSADERLFDGTPSY
jgi:sporulation protein YlmC with PRC-barrel domain